MPGAIASMPSTTEFAAMPSARRRPQGPTVGHARVKLAARYMREGSRYYPPAMDVPASAVFSTHLGIGHFIPRSLVVALVLGRNIVLGALGAVNDAVAPASIVVRRKEDGTVVGRIPASGYYYEQLDTLASVRRGLETRSVEAFLSDWGLDDA